jgi:vacuolar-type H+-ATPase subunit E/Vma4
VINEMVDAAKQKASRIRADAQAEASTMLKKARHRRTELLDSAARDVERVEAEKARLGKAAEELRDELASVLTATLEQLRSTVAEEQPALREVPAHGSAAAKRPRRRAARHH